MVLRVIWNHQARQVLDMAHDAHGSTHYHFTKALISSMQELTGDHLIHQHMAFPRLSPMPEHLSPQAPTTSPMQHHDADLDQPEHVPQRWKLATPDISLNPLPNYETYEHLIDRFLPTFDEETNRSECQPRWSNQSIAYTDGSHGETTLPTGQKQHKSGAAVYAPVTSERPNTYQARISLGDDNDINTAELIAIEHAMERGFTTIATRLCLSAGY